MIRAQLTASLLTASRPIAQPAYRQPSAGATWVRMLSMTWAL